ncbi:KGGVGR-motif variant AAA ATPase [Mucilaginibacter sp. Mucisp86]|uniref:KGGVGR-motif variant AAA ATPase n=1 Tax=Mucilaginibacter sp. Mucisp86 TaxID=3243060 RepID=UPI0039B558F4
MIKILEVADKLNKELQSKKEVQLEDYRIFIRLNLEIDVYIITTSQSLISELETKYKDYYVNFKRFSNAEIQQYSYLSESFKASQPIDFGLKYRFNSLLDKKPNSFYEVNRKFPIPIVTFYSYKGGMGRTTTLTSYALDLAINYNKKVCIIDCDLEAPGYLNFFDFSHNEILKSGEKNGIVEFLVDHAFKKEINIKDYLISPSHFQSWAKKISVIPAGNLSDSTIQGSDNYTTHRDQYLEGLSRIDLAEGALIEGFKVLFEKVRDEVNPDIILIDSRTGFNDVFAITALILSNLIVGFFGSNEQTKPGLRFLLDKFYELNNQNNNDTELVLVNSILPANPNSSEMFHNAFVSEIGQYVQFLQENKYKNIGPSDETKLPSFYKLSRNHTLEKLGINNETSKSTDFSNHIGLIRNKSFNDFNAIFRAFNESKSVAKIFTIPQIKDPRRMGQLKNLILKNLKATLRNENDNPVLFAEDADVNPNTFFYRDQMSKLFDKNKFLIQGFKGTGKTYLYKALRDPKLQSVKRELLRRAKEDPNKDFRFIDIISLKGKAEPKSFDFDQIQLSKIEDKNHYFKNFWLVYTWHSIFLDAKHRLNYLSDSQLASYIKPFESPIETKQRFDSLINDENKLAIIEKELLVLDEFLNKKSSFLVVLYDQLDNLIKPIFWRETVSPLIDYWWDSLNRFKNITAKIFIRTDLYNRLIGTNTTRLENNIIKIEWSREEVYAYFFKLIFSNKHSYEALFQIMELSGKFEERFFKNTPKFLQKNNNQLNLLRNEIDPFMSTFFGKEVKSYSGGFLGKTFDWFYFNLTNADQQSISLRPFINLIDGSIDEALQDQSTQIPPIIKYQYYASRENRENAVIQHFNDLVREDFNQDLEFIFIYLREKGDNFKQIFLTKTELHELLQAILNEYKEQLESQNIDDLKSILISNGIIHENVTPHENIFYFAQLYKYWLGLRSRKYEYRGRN